MTPFMIIKNTIKNVLSLHRPGLLTTPLLVDSPHSGEIYPDDFKPAVSSKLYKCAEDRFVHELFGAAAQSGGMFLEALFPRVYIDPNRSVDNIDPAKIENWTKFARTDVRSKLGKGLIWTESPPDGGALYDRVLTVQEIENRIDNYYNPYYDTLLSSMKVCHSSFGIAYHLDCHSMQEYSTNMHENGAGSKRPDVTLSDMEGKTCEPEYIEFAKTILTEMGLNTLVNDPYKGAHLIQTTGKPDKGWHSMQIEVNRGLYMNEIALRKTDNFSALQNTFSRFIDQLAEFTRSRIG